MPHIEGGIFPIAAHVDVHNWSYSPKQLTSPLIGIVF